MTTPILGIEEVASGQVNQYLVYNTALRALEAAANDLLIVDLSGDNATVSSEDYTSHGVILAQGADTAGRELELPSSRRALIIINEGSESIDIAVGSAAEALASGESAWFVTTGDADTLHRV